MADNFNMSDWISQHKRNPNPVAESEQVYKKVVLLLESELEHLDKQQAYRVWAKLKTLIDSVDK